MHRWAIRRLRTSPSWRSGILLVFLTLLAVVGMVASPVSSTVNLVDPGLDTIMRMTPEGFQRSERDRFPNGPMSAATFNAVGIAAVPVRGDNAVFYGASYERSDGAVVVFMGMSTSHRADGQGFADGVIKGTLTDGKAFSAGIAGVSAVEGESNGLRSVAIVFARNGRGFAVMSFGNNARDDGSRFARFVAGLAESTPTRSDAKPEERLRPAAAGLAAVIALAVFGIVAFWRFAHHRRNISRGGPASRPGARFGPAANSWAGNTDNAETLEHPVHTDSPPRPSPRPNPR